jgi:hypothetical protein
MPIRVVGNSTQMNDAISPRQLSPDVAAAGPGAGRQLAPCGPAVARRRSR